MELPKVSILLAVYNGANFIKEAIESVKLQYYQNWELIIVDNGSNDLTSEICEFESNQEIRIKFYKLKEKGKTRAYSKAFENSTGDYICFFAADDKLTTTSLENRLSIINTDENFSCSTCLLETFSDDEAHNGVVFPKKRESPNFSGGSIFFDKEIAKMIFPIPDHLPNEDTWTSLHLRAFGINKHLPEVCYKYRIHNNNSYGYGLSFDEKRKRFLQRMEAFLLFFERYKNSNNDFVTNYVSNFSKGIQLCTAQNKAAIIFLKGVSVRDKLIFIFYCSPFLYKIRYKYFKFFSGLFN